MLISNEDHLAQINNLLKQLSGNTKPITFEELEKVQKNGNVAILRVKESNEIVAMGTLIFLQTMTGKLGRIEDVVVDKHYRGQGLGRRIVESLIAKAREIGIKHIDLTSSPHRKAANALYKKVGFKRRETNVYRLVL